MAVYDWAVKVRMVYSPKRSIRTTRDTCVKCILIYLSSIVKHEMLPM